MTSSSERSVGTSTISCGVGDLVELCIVKQRRRRNGNHVATGRKLDTRAIWPDEGDDVDTLVVHVHALDMEGNLGIGKVIAGRIDLHPDGMGGKRLLMLTILVDEPRRCSDKRAGDKQNEENDESAMSARRWRILRHLRLGFLRILRLGCEGRITIRTGVRRKDGMLAYLEGGIKGILLRQHDGLVRREVEVSCFAGKIKRLREICVLPRHVRYLTTRTG